MKRKAKKSVKFNHMIGNTIFRTSCTNNPNQFEYAEIIDIININRMSFFLVKAQEEYYIYKMIAISKYAYVNSETFRKYRSIFENSNNWINKTTLFLSRENKIIVIV